MRTSDKSASLLQQLMKVVRKVGHEERRTDRAMSAKKKQGSLTRGLRTRQVPRVTLKLGKP